VAVEGMAVKGIAVIGEDRHPDFAMSSTDDMALL